MTLAVNLEPAACKIDSWAQGYVPSLFTDEPKMVGDLDEDERRAAEASFYSPSKMDILAQLSKETINGSKKNSPGDSPRSNQKPKLKTSFRTSEKSAEGPEKALGPPKEIKLARPPPNKRENNLSNSQFMKSREEEAALEADLLDEKLKREARLNRTTKDQIDLKLIEDSIAKAPLACQSVLKVSILPFPFLFPSPKPELTILEFQTLLSRPMAMREIEIDSEGNITSITKLDPDKLHSR